MRHNACDFPLAPWKKLFPPGLRRTALACGVLLVGVAAGCGKSSSTESSPQGGPADASSDVSAAADGALDGGKDGNGPDGWPTTDASKDSAIGDAPADVAEAAIPDADFRYDGGGQTAWNALPTKCSDAAEKGVLWLVSQQNADGSWASAPSYREAATGLAVVKLETYAIEKGISPFDPAFIYRNNVVSGLNYLFGRLVTVPLDPTYDMNGDGVGLRMSGETNYVHSITLMAITAGRGVTQVVNAPGSPVDTWKYDRVAQDMVDAFAECQVASQGGWRYSCPSGDSDNSVSQYVTLALEYAEHPDYGFMATIPQFTKDRLVNWVAYIQDGSGGSSYASPGDWVNPYKTGALLQQFALLQQNSTAPQVQAAVSYLDAHWAEPISSMPADYMAMWSIMKGLVTQQIDMVGAHDWYTEYCDVLVAQQNADGSWPLTTYDAANGVLSTAWALLVLEKAAPAGLY